MFKRIKRYLIFKFDRYNNFQFVDQVSSKKEALRIALEIEGAGGWFATVIHARHFWFLFEGRLC